MKKILAKAACILLGASLLSGCGKQPGADGKAGAGDKSQSVDPTVAAQPTGADEPSGKGQGAGSGNAGDGQGDGHTGTAQDEDGKDGADSVQDGSSAGGTAVFPELKNYRERAINLHPDIEGLGEWTCGALQNAEGEIEWFTIDSRLSKADTLILKYTLDGASGSWEKEPVTWTEGIKGKLQEGRITILLGEDGSYYAYYCDEGQLYHFVKQEGDSYKEIVIPHWDITQERDYRMIPGRVCVAENGNIVMADQGYECYIYSGEDGQILDSFRCGWYESICVEGNELFIMKDRTNNAVFRYDIEKLEPLPEVEGNFEGGVRLAVEGDDLYACCPQGVFRAEKDGGSFQKIMDAGKYLFSKENATLMNLFMVKDGFYVTYAEQRGVIKKYAPRDPDELFLGEFTVYSLEDKDLILDMVVEFQAQHPEIDVFYETGEGGGGSTTAADRIRALNARILAGDGPDVLVLDGLPAQAYVEKGILADFSAVLEEEKENITPNILANFMQGDALYMLPIRVMIPMFGTSGQDPSIFDSLEAFAAYCEEEEKQALPAGMPYQYFIEFLYYNFPPEFVAEDKSVSKEKIDAFLGLVKRVCDAEHALTLAESEYSVADSGYFWGNTLDHWFMADGQELIFINMAGNLSYFPDKVRQRGGQLLENHGMYFTNGVLGINARSEEKELAEMFVKEAFSYHLQDFDSFRPGFPVHVKCLEEFSQEDFSRNLSGYRLIDSGKMITFKGFTQEEARKMADVVRSVHIPVERNEMIYEIIEDETLSFLSGAKSRQAAAEEIANRISLYYFE